MRSLFGLAVPLLLLVASFSTMVPQAAAQSTYHTISGRVVSDNGEPLEGVFVNAYSYSEERMHMDDGLRRHADAITDADGAYSLRLPPGKGWINVHYEKWRQGDGREIVIDGDLSSIDFTLRTPPPKTAIIEGRVVDGDGRPVEGAEVNLQTRCCYAYPAYAEDAPVASDEGNGTSASMPVARRIMPPDHYYWDDHAVTRTDSDGRFRFEAYEGPRQVYAWAKGYAQTTVPVDAVANRTVSVDVVLEKVPASDAVVTGRVIDSSTGLPLARAQVSLRSLEWGRHAWAETDNDGRFRLTTVPGWAELSVHHYAHPEPIPIEDGPASKPLILPAQGPQYYPFLTLAELKSGENRLDAPIDPKPKPTIALIGYVVDPKTKQAVPDARVNVWNHETGDWGEALTDATGSYRILVRPGHYSGSAWKEGYLGGTQTFRVTDQATQRVDILMPKGTPKWAPCYDAGDACYGPMMHGGRAEMAVPMPVPTMAPSAPRGEYDSAAKTADAPSPAPGVAPTMGGQATAEASTAGASGPDRTRGATFAGEGGGLPPYDPDASGETVTSNEDGAAPANVPGAGALLAALALAGAALVAMRRRG
ncbi:MAG TPA: carboxypeptidase-like regulatory domain-containing protein [Candidatus Thermoplasmatota archaeon]|nr:carboxypeptidase-like regulatory domain-containing protein [Candidatus Thermoplasmatota archaeon]